MSQTPVTVTYSLEEVLGKINEKLEGIESQIQDTRTEFNVKLDRFNEKLDTLQNDFNEFKVNQAKLEVELKGEIKVQSIEINALAKQVQNQEFINRSILAALIVALIGGAAKLFGWVGNP